MWPAVVMSLSNALENETANGAFWLHKLYALPINADHLRKQVGLSNACGCAFEHFSQTPLPVWIKVLSEAIDVSWKIFEVNGYVWRREYARKPIFRKLNKTFREQGISSTVT